MQCDALEGKMKEGSRGLGLYVNSTTSLKMRYSVFRVCIYIYIYIYIYISLCDEGYPLI